MSEIRTIDLIHSNARRAVEQLETQGKAPVNPYLQDTDAYKEWTLAFYKYGIERGIAQEA